MEDGGYELIQIDGNGGDEMDALVVYRRDTSDIIQAAALMGVTIGRPLTCYRGIEAMVGKRPDQEPRASARQPHRRRVPGPSRAG